MGIVVEEEIVLAPVLGVISVSFVSPTTGTDGEDVVVGTTGLSSATVLVDFSTDEAFVTLGAAALVVVAAGAALLLGTPVHRFPPMVVILKPACRGTL